MKKVYKKTKLVYGVGLNDADYHVHGESHLSEFVTNKKNAVCPFYNKWASMLERCYSDKYHETKPSYKGCTVCDEWLTFSNFKAWMEKQDWEGKYLDKDLLFVGNKQYSPDTCVFISKKLNSFMTERSALRGEWPIGVSFRTKKNVFDAKINNPFTGKREFLGYYCDPLLAHEAWLSRKLELACEFASLESDKSISEAIIKRYENYVES